MNETWLATRLYVFEGNDCPSLLLSIDDRAVVVSIRFSGAHILCCSCVFPVPENQRDLCRSCSMREVVTSL